MGCNGRAPVACETTVLGGKNVPSQSIGGFGTTPHLKGGRIQSFVCQYKSIQTQVQARRMYHLVTTQAHANHGEPYSTTAPISHCLWTTSSGPRAPVNLIPPTRRARRQTSNTPLDMVSPRSTDCTSEHLLDNPHLDTPCSRDGESPWKGWFTTPTSRRRHSVLSRHSGCGHVRASPAAVRRIHRGWRTRLRARRGQFMSPASEQGTNTPGCCFLSGILAFVPALHRMRHTPFLCVLSSTFAVLRLSLLFGDRCCILRLVSL